MTHSISSFFWHHIKPYKWYYVVMLMAPVVSSFYPFAYNYAIKLFLDVMVTSSTLHIENLISPIVLFMAAQLIMTLAWRISNIAEWKAEPYVRKSIILSSFDYVQHHSFRFFQDHFTGAISSKLKGLLDGYDKFWAEMHHGLLQRIFKIGVNISALFWVNFYLGAFVFIWGIVYLPIMYFFSKKLNKLTFIETEARHHIIGQISDKIMNIIALFAYTARKNEHQSLKRYIHTDFIPKQVKAYQYDFMMQIWGDILYIIMIIFILLYVIHLKTLGLITIGDFALVFGLTLVVSEDIWHATVSLQEFARAMGDLKSALSILQTPQSNLDHPEAKILHVQNPTIEFKQINFGYDPKHTIFQNLNLKIKAGEKIGLVGHSGAGKSSLINLLLKYVDYQQGEILVDNQNITFVTQNSLRENIAVIPQDTMLFHRTLMENIHFGRQEASEQEVIQASQKAHIHDFIMNLPKQYDTYVGERGIKLSGGQRQRISIARAILKNAPILILDEATSSLDSHTEKLIQDSLNFFIEDQGKTVIAIAHRLSTLKHMDRIIVLDKGQIVEEGKHDELIQTQDSLYKQLWEHQEI